MRRHTFIYAFGLVLGLLIAPLAAEAQEYKAGKIPRIGWLGNMAAPPPPVTQLEGFLQGLRELGYVEGKNVAVEYRWAEGKLDRLPELARDLARLKVDVMIVGGQQGLEAGKQAGGIPIVTVACDPLDSLVMSLARPGGGATGVTCISSELVGKRLELLKEIVPKLSRVGVIFNPDDRNKTAEVRQAEMAARALRLTLESFKVRAVEEFKPTFGAMKRERIEAVMMLADPFMNFHRKRLADLTGQNRLPSIYGFREYADAGGLMAYGANLGNEFRRAATYVDKILKGARPGDLPVEQPTKFELVINMKTAKVLGLTIPPSLLLRADQVIQ